MVLILSVFPVFVAKGATPGASLTFPIKELGSCTNRSSCFAFCEKPDNSPACWSWGESQKTFVLGESTMNEAIESLEKKLLSLGVSFPIGDLGNCENAPDCHRYCGRTENRTACTNFSLRIGMQNKQPVINEIEQQILLGLVKQVLGCSDTKACKAVCQKNPTKCQEVIAQVRAKKDRIARDLLLEKAKKELGCTNFDSCRNLCNARPAKCEAFVKKFNLAPVPEITANEKSGLPKKLGCATSAECRAWCQENPTKCPGFTATKLVPQTTTTPAKNTASPAP
jgi:hypothetical protein